MNLVEMRTVNIVGRSIHDSQEDYLAAIRNTCAIRFFPSDLYVNLRIYQLEELSLSHIQASARSTTRTPALISNDRRDHVCFLYSVSGSALYQTQDKISRIEAGHLFLIDLSQPFTLRDLSPQTTIALSVPRARVSPMVSRPSALHGLTAYDSESLPLTDLMQAAVRYASNLPISSARPLGQALMAMVELVLSGLAQRPSTSITNEASRPKQRALELIRDHLGSRELSPDWLASKLHMSRSQLYALFRDQGGVSKAIWLERVHGAQTALEDVAEARRIGEIAYAFGFQTEAHFARSFRNAFGTSPRSYRRNAAAARTSLKEEQDRSR